MHGVSDPFVSRAFESFGFPPFVPVLEQQQPDPDFPTVAFPNPEEKGCLNHVYTRFQADHPFKVHWYDDI
jgi:phosphoglucomutase